jgi:hypothetical protein
LTIQVLSRLTTVFHPNEDRIRISGQGKDGNIEVIWLTQRLVNRLVPVMTKWLETREAGTPRADLLQSVKQQRAQVQQAEQSGEQGVVPAEQAENEWLAVSLDIQQREDAFRIIFKDQTKEPEHQAVLELQPMLLRQWLNVVLLAYTQGEWSLEKWPEWMIEQIKPAGKAERKALH